MNTKSASSRYFWIVFIVLLTACGSTPPATETPTATALPATETPTATVVVVLPTLPPTQSPPPILTPDAIQVERWKEYQTKLAKIVLSSNPELGNNPAIYKGALCEWDVLGRSDHEVYVYAVCVTASSHRDMRNPAIIYLEPDGSIRKVELPEPQKDSLMFDYRPFPKDVQEKFCYYFDPFPSDLPPCPYISTYPRPRLDTLYAHIEYRKTHPEEPPLVVLSAMPAVPVIETPTAANTPEASAMKPKQPPACTFPLAEITTEEATPEEYAFSEPQVVLTAPQGNIYHIAEWLPDNQQVLMTEEIRNVAIGNSDPIQESISLFNPETGESQVYAFRTVTYESPSWVAGLNAVVYPTIHYTSLDRKNGTSKFTRQIWISYGDPETAQKLDDNLPQFPVAVKPDGSEILYLSNKNISKLDKTLKKLSSLSLDPTQWDYGKGLRDKNPVYYSMEWQPGTSLIFLYSNNTMGGGGYTFILDAKTGYVCEVDFGGWASEARWSPDGRYLAIGRVANSNPSDLTLLDTATGNITTLRGIPQGIEGHLYISDFIWAPDNRHLLALGSVHSSQNSQNGNNAQGLYLVDIALDQSVYVVQYESIVSSEDSNWAWSYDSSKLLMRCPTQVVDRICLISVQSVKQ